MLRYSLLAGRGRSRREGVRVLAATRNAWSVPLIPTFSPRAGRRRTKMPLQNRVTPTGDIIATPHRGMFTGNRGIIHDPATKTLTRRWASRAWLTCLCEFRDRRREVMGGRSWTELFFL